jgi:hypothetical protein
VGNRDIGLAVAHLFGFYNPKQLADFLDVPHQQFYTELKEWSVYYSDRSVLDFLRHNMLRYTVDYP